MDDALRVYGAAVGAIDLELDWAMLGRCTCEGDGSEFFDAELRERILDVGFQFVGDLSSALGSARGRSLYLGAEIAELPIVMAEHLVLGRQVEWLNIASAATTEITRAIGVVGARLGVLLPAPSVATLDTLAPSSFDHLWMVSVLTDPDAFPALHDELYERTGGPLATGRGVLAGDRQRAAALVDALLDRAAPRAVLSTTDEERTVVAALAAKRGWQLSFTRGGRLSSIVGDRVRIGRLRRADAGRAKG